MKDKLKHLKNKICGMVGDHRPTAMQLEVTNACNFRCVMCPFHGPEKASDRTIGFMPVDTYRRVLGEFSKMGGTFLIPQGAGESFLHPDFAEMLRIAKKEFGLMVGLNTNGSRLTPDMMDLVLDLGIDELGFSIDAVKPGTFREITGGDLDQVSESINVFLGKRAQRKDPTVPVVRVLMVEQDANRSETTDYINNWIPLVDEVIIQSIRTGAGRKLETARTEKRKACRHLFDTAFIQWDGEMVACCEDWESVTSVGNINNASLESLWHSATMKTFRTAQKNGSWSPPDICVDCEAWAGGCEKTVDHGDRIEIVSALTRLWRRKN